MDPRPSRCAYGLAGLGDGDPCRPVRGAGQAGRAGREHADELVAEEVSQTGKPVRLATEFDVPGSVDNIDFFADAARHLEGKATAEYSADHTSSIRREAIGVVGTITPWNYPLQMAVWKVLPALAAGCTVVIKPARDDTADDADAGPAGQRGRLARRRVQRGDGGRLRRRHRAGGHPDVDLVTFTGSTAVGRKVMAAAAVHGHRVQLELGARRRSWCSTTPTWTPRSRAPSRAR